MKAKTLLHPLQPRPLRLNDTRSPNGCSLSHEQERLLSEALPDGGTIELLLDNDEAGHHGTEEIAARILKFALVRSLSLPEDVLQPDELCGDEIAELFE